MASLEHRTEAYKLLRGHGLEIGALNKPARIPNDCTVEYCDAYSRDELGEIYPELNAQDCVEVQHVCDLDKNGLEPFRKNTFDFVIANHVLEHVANPIRSIEEIFRVTRRKGIVILSIPDQDYASDKKRELTSFGHLLEEYRNHVTEVTDEHYIDFLRDTYPGILELEEEELEHYMARVRKRRDHAHVWNSPTFSDCLARSLHLLAIKADCLLESTGPQNGFEHFSVWRKKRMGGWFIKRPRARRSPSNLDKPRR